MKYDFSAHQTIMTDIMTGFVLSSNNHITIKRKLPLSIPKSANASSEPLLVISNSPFRVKIIDLSSKFIIQPTTSPGCQLRPKNPLP